MENKLSSSSPNLKIFDIIDTYCEIKRLESSYGNITNLNILIIDSRQKKSYKIKIRRKYKNEVLFYE